MGDQKHQDRMYTPFSTKDRLDTLVSVLCEKEQLLESTIRDLFSHGWMYHGDRWIKHRSIRGTQPNQAIFDEANQFND